MYVSFAQNYGYDLKMRNLLTRHQAKQTIISEMSCIKLKKFSRWLKASLADVIAVRSECRREFRILFRVWTFTISNDSILRVSSVDRASYK